MEAHSEQSPIQGKARTTLALRVQHTSPLSGPVQLMMGTHGQASGSGLGIMKCSKCSNSFPPAEMALKHQGIAPLTQGSRVCHHHPFSR